MSYEPVAFPFLQTFLSFLTPDFRINKPISVSKLT